MNTSALSIVCTELVCPHCDEIVNVDYIDGDYYTQDVEERDVYCDHCSEHFLFSRTSIHEYKARKK